MLPSTQQQQQQHQRRRALLLRADPATAPFLAAFRLARRGPAAATVIQRWWRGMHSSLQRLRRYYHTRCTGERQRVLRAWRLLHAARRMARARVQRRVLARLAESAATTRDVRHVLVRLASKVVFGGAGSVSRASHALAVHLVLSPRCTEGPGALPPRPPPRPPPSALVASRPRPPPRVQLPLPRLLPPRASEGRLAPLPLDAAGGIAASGDAPRDGLASTRARRLTTAAGLAAHPVPVPQLIPALACLSLASRAELRERILASRRLHDAAAAAAAAPAGTASRARSLASSPAAATRLAAAAALRMHPARALRPETFAAHAQAALSSDAALGCALAAHESRVAGWTRAVLGRALRRRAGEAFVHRIASVCSDVAQRTAQSRAELTRALLRTPMLVSSGAALDSEAAAPRTALGEPHGLTAMLRRSAPAVVGRRSSFTGAAALGAPVLPDLAAAAGLHDPFVALLRHVECHIKRAWLTALRAAAAARRNRMLLARARLQRLARLFCGGDVSWTAPAMAQMLLRDWREWARRERRRRGEGAAAGATAPRRPARAAASPRLADDG